MLAYSETFRKACRSFDEPLWTGLMQSINQNHVSLELFFKVRGLDWIVPLRYVERLVSPKVLAAYIEHQKPRELPALFSEKPHSYVVPSREGTLYRPSYQGLLHLNVSSNIYDLNAFRQDPSRCNENNVCYSCGSRSCGCEPPTCESVTRPLVELIHCSAKKGLGVRTLQRIRRDDVLDEYCGALKYASSVTDYTYALELEREKGSRVRSNNPILIDAQLYGNWTRYINASCDPSLKFVPMTIGKRYRMMVVATRDVDSFEELTVGYGDDYWLESDTQMCICNAPNCRYADNGRKERLRRNMIAPADADMMEVDG